LSLRFTRNVATPGEALGRSRGGLGTKIVGVCDAAGRLVDFLLAPGQAHELAPSLTLLRRLPEAPSWALADMACDAAAFRAEVRAMGAIPVVPSRRGTKQPQPCPAYIYRHRNLIERCWARLIPAARTLDSSVDCRAAGISLISRAAATPTLRAYQSALRAAGIRPSFPLFR